MPKMIIPKDVPQAMHTAFQKNLNTLLPSDDSACILFAFDQKMEHPATDFVGKNIDKEAADPAHAFAIAAASPINAFATHLGLIAHYAERYPGLTYIAKLNGKTNLFTSERGDPVSRQLWTIDDVMNLKKSGANIVGIGYTVYLGSAHESIMLAEASQCIAQAHSYGLVAIIWAYPRGASVAHERDPLVVAGAAGVAASLGADIVKVNAPEPRDGKTTEQWLHDVITAAGTTKVVCAGGQQKNVDDFIHDVVSYRRAGVAGIAVGRNVFQRSHNEAVALLKALDKALPLS